MTTRFLPCAEWDGNEVSSLARHLGTPLYIYDLAQLSRTVETLRDNLRPFGGKLYFATMANDREAVLTHLAQAGLGACVNSIPHLELAMKCGFDVADIQFTSTGITREDMERLCSFGIRVNVDSLAQLRQWFALGGRTAGLRINAASLTGATHGDRIGMDVPDARAAAQIAEGCGRTIDGVHVYVGTNFQAPEGMFPTLDAFFELAGSFPDLRYVNIGGGIGIDYAAGASLFDLGVFADHVKQLADDLRRRLANDISIVVEPGRSITASCAAYVVSITDRKRLNGVEYLAVDGSIAQFPRPFHHPETLHRVRVISSTGADSAGALSATIVGRTTFSRDILGKASICDTVQPRDYVLIENAGSYSQSMASRFLGQREPHQEYLRAPVRELIAAE